MIKKIIYALGVVLVCIGVRAQQPEQWVKIIQDYPADHQNVGAFDFDSLGNIYFPTCFRKQHSILYVLDKYGNTINKKHFLSSMDVAEITSCIVTHNNIEMLGCNDYTTSNFSASPQLIKMDNCGNIQHQKNYVETGMGHIRIGIPTFFEKTNNGYIAGFYYEGSNDTYSIIIEFDNNSNIIKIRSYPITFQDYLQTPQGPIIIGVRDMLNLVDSSVWPHAVIARLDTNDLGLVWYHPHNYMEQPAIEGKSIVFNTDGSLLFNTFIQNIKSVSSLTAFIQKYDVNGNLQWTRPTTDSFKYELPYKSLKINDSVVFETGVKRDAPFNSYTDYLMLRLVDTSGKVLKTKAYKEYKINPSALKITPDNKVMVSGTVWDNIYYLYRPCLIKFRLDLEIDSFINPGSTHTGLCNNFNSDTVYMDSAEVLHLKIEKPTGIVLPPTYNSNQTELEYYRVFPNPTNDILYIQSRNNGITDYNIYDSKGALIYNGKFTGIIKSVDIGNYIPGIYFIKIENGRYNKSFKIIKE